MSFFRERLDYYETKNFTIGNKILCSYCGKECKESLQEYDEYDFRLHYYCECEDAKKELEIKEEVLNVNNDARIKVIQLERELPKENSKMVDEINYKHEIELVHKRYRR